jgi:peptide/nickel transport system ATP-binding protein
LFNRCAHPYTRALLEAVPRARPGRQRQRRGMQVIASQSKGATGCAYAGRCPYADAHCRASAPVARSVGAGHYSACHHAETVMALPALAGEV